MSKNIEKQLNDIALCFKGMFKDLNTIAENIAGVNTMKNELEAIGNYTPAYIEDVINKEISEKRAPKNALVIDTIEAAIADFTDATNAILNAGDVFEDERLIAALSAVSNMDKTAINAAGIVARQFAGNFPALELLASAAPCVEVRNVINKNNVDADALEALTDRMNEGVIELKVMNSARDFVGLATRVYNFEKVLRSNAETYGVIISADDYPALAALFEAKQGERIRAAFGL